MALRQTPWRLGYWPVKMLPRAGAHTGWLQKAERNRTPRGGHAVQVRREVHGVEPHGPDAIPAELVGDDEYDVRPVGRRAGLRQGRGGRRHARQPVSPCRVHWVPEAHTISQIAAIAIACAHALSQGIVGRGRRDGRGANQPARRPASEFRGIPGRRSRLSRRGSVGRGRPEDAPYRRACRGGHAIHQLVRGGAGLRAFARRAADGPLSAAQRRGG